MQRYLARSLLLMVPTLVLATAVNFFILRLAPGNPAVLLAGPDALPAQIEALRQSMGLDRPLPVQFGLYLQSLLHGDLGYSYSYNLPAAELLLSRLPATLLLTGTAFAVAVPLGIVTGVLAARWAHTLRDTGASLLALALYSVPNFWLGLMAIYFFAVVLKWFPAQGMNSPGIGPGSPEFPSDLLRHLVLPALVLGALNVALFHRFSRSSLLNVIGQEYVLVARSKGCSEWRVLVRHALPNAALPIVSMLGLAARNLVMGSALVETVFSWPGMGRLMYEAVLGRDYVLLSGGFLIFSLVQVISSFATDLAYVAVDPRVRLGG